MSIKLLVLYPRPEDAERFERDYREAHLPLMRKLLGEQVSFTDVQGASNSDSRRALLSSGGNSFSRPSRAR